MKKWLTAGVVCDLNRIRGSRYEISLKVDEAPPEDTTYIGLVSRNTTTLLTLQMTAFPSAALERPLQLIEDKVQVGLYCVHELTSSP